LIYRKLGDFPKTHFLRDLLDKVLELYGAVCNLDDFLRRRSAVLAYLLNQAEVAGKDLQVPEHAYITSRYLPFRARREDYEVAHDALFYMESSIPCGTRCSVLTTSASRG
jgi:HEPN domain-containing protein